MTSLYAAMIIHSFGHASRRPKRASTIRLVLLGAGACVAAIGLSKLVLSMQLIALPHPLKLLLPAYIAAHVLVVLALMSAQSLAIHDTYARLIHSLPIRPHVRIVMLRMPEAILVVLSLLAFGVPLACVFTALGLPVLLTATCFGLGVCVAGAVQEATRHFSAGTRILTLGVYSLALYYGARQALTGPPEHGYLAYAGVLLISMAVCIRAYTLRHRMPKSTVSLPRLSGKTPASYWPLIQACRHTTTRTGLMTAFGVSLLASIAVFRSTSIDLTLIASATSLLAAVTAADIRTVARHTRPAEITALRGTLHFVRAEFLVAHSLVVLAVLPFGITHIAMGGTPGQWLTALLIGIASGALASTCIAPAPRDISAQFSATLTAGGIVFGLPHIMPTFASAPGLIVLTALLWIVACAVEYNRNRYLWRHYVHSS